MEGMLLERLERHGVIPVLAVERPERAIGLADALVAGGLPIAEITFRTSGAADAIRRLWAERPGVLVGAGTVITQETVVRARDAGAQFLVTPGLNPNVVKKAHDLGMVIMPGIQTPSELEEALELGCKVVKLFPAEVSGGVRLIQALAGPYRHTGVRFVPTGGVSAGNLASYLAEDTVIAVGGTWIARKDDVSEGRWADITERCREAAGMVAEVRGPAQPER